jgi:hypothetical protein
MGLKGAGHYFQRSMSNTVLAGLVYRICELYIDDVLIHGKDPETFLRNVNERLREFNVAVNPNKTKLGLAEVEYVGHVVPTTGTSFTEEKRLKVLQFPLPETQKKLLQFIRVYAKTKKKKTLEELKILPICSKKRVCEKLFWKKFSKFKY